MRNGSERNRRWGVILAGGDGVRLRPLTRFIEGDDRPKQFCRLLGRKTLLAQTRSRIVSSVKRNQTLFVLTRSHERFYAQELRRVAADRMIVQPANRGTLPAIFCSLLSISRSDADAEVAFFPSDHHYEDQRKFMEGVESAFAAARAQPGTVILLGAAARHPETAYGWIEPDPASADGLPLVRRFWEKPSLPEAQILLERGCLWNTFVMVGQVRAFFAMIEAAVPGLCEALSPLAMDTAALEAVYSRIEPGDFSRQVLSAQPDKLAVLDLGDVGWSDLGDPQRVVSTLSRKGVESSWVAPWHRSLAASAG